MASTLCKSVRVMTERNLTEEELRGYVLSSFPTEELDRWAQLSKYGTCAHVPGPDMTSDLETCRLWMEVEHGFTPSIFPIEIDGSPYLALIAYDRGAEGVDCKTFTPEGARAYKHPPRPWVAARCRELLARDRGNGRGPREYDFYMCDTMPGHWVGLDE